MTLTLEGRAQTVTLLTGPVALARAGQWPLALAVFLAASLLPGLRLAAATHALLPAWRGGRPRLGARAFRAMAAIRPWAMTEVYLLGVIVAYVKLADLARVDLGAAVPAFVGVVALTAAAEAAVEPRAVWARYGAQARAGALGPGRPVSCHGCGQLVPEAFAAAAHGGAGGGGRAPGCPRCGAGLHRRKPGSLARTWALWVAAAVLYVPANLLPMLEVTYFGRGEPDTILSGVVALLAEGQAPVAALVFFASVTVPVLKLGGLLWLLAGVQLGRADRPRARTRLYRAIEGVGRWSMVDVFMISILVAIVDLGAVATIRPGPAAPCFAAVVILTMLASLSFDPRLIWDARERAAGDGPRDGADAVAPAALARA